MAITQAQELVAAFHRKYDVPQPGAPVEALDDASGLRHSKRMGWIDDERVEGDDAVEDGNIADLADAYVDIIVFALGGLVELGIDGGPLFDAVMAANMTKIKLSGVDKIAKGSDFRHPDIAALIEAQRKA
jgi:hypothetical protein